MKKLFTLSLLISFSILSFAQIVLTSSNMPTAGWSQRVAKDSLPLPTISWGNKGTNQLYDFSSLQVFKYDTTNYITPTGTQQTNFPGCDLAITSDGTNFLYTKTTTDSLVWVGLEGVLSGVPASAVFSPKNKIAKFPTQYGNTFPGSWGFQTTVPGSAVNQPVYQVRVTFTATFNDTIDGWGRLKTPVGSYKCLRQNRKEFSHTVIEFKLFSFSPWSTASDTRDTTLRYGYYTREAKGGHMTFEFDSLDNVISATYSMVPPTAPIADFTWSNVSGGLVSFTDNSDNYPDSWSWTFGDGGTSTLQNPNHTYTANGNYNVCLTATNAGGSNQICKTVTVSGITAANNAPVAFDDTLSIVAGNQQIIHVAGNDIDPDGDNICVDSVWGSPYATEYIGGTCDMILYAPDTSFAGSDTCYYLICDDGTPVKCDTGMVVFTVQGINHAPNAVNDANTTLQPGTGYFNVGTNDSDPDGDNFCLTLVYGSAAFSIAPTGNCTTIAFAPDSTFTGNDTCWYVICDNGAPQLCDTALYVVTVNANPALLPVASFYWHPTSLDPCSAVDLISTSLGADSSFWNVRDLLSSFTSSGTGDSITLPVSGGISFGSVNGEVCLTVKNKFGSSTKCDTMEAWCEGINDSPLTGIRFYPTPANTHITIDMRNNTENLSTNYSSIYIYNALGQLVMQLSPQGKLITVNVSGLPQGIYTASIADKNESRRSLGRFTVNR